MLHRYPTPPSGAQPNQSHPPARLKWSDILKILLAVLSIITIFVLKWAIILVVIGIIFVLAVTYPKKGRW